jgi:alkylation response protein AidB-like acyl-CoA dehydrogenase
MSSSIPQPLNAARFENFLGSEYSEKSDFSFKTAIDYDEQDEFPYSHLEAVIKSGFFHYFIPKNTGGKLDCFDRLIKLAVVMSRRDMTTAIAVGQTFLGALPVWIAGTDKQKKTLAQYIFNGQLGCLALTEKENGSDILSTQVTATETDEGYRLNGKKWVINNATRGATMSILVRLRMQTGREKLACLFLEKSMLNPGEYHNIEKIKTHGIRGADISGICFNNCLIQKSALIPALEPDIYTIFKTLQISRILCAGFSLGAFDTALRITYKFALNRRLYSKGIIEIPSVSKTLTDSYLQLLINGILAQVCARSISHIPEQLSLFSAICKYYIPRRTEQAIDKLKVVLGARFYLREEHCYGIFQKLSRDNEVVGVFDGSSQVNLSLISTQMTSLAKRFKTVEFSVHPLAIDLLISSPEHNAENALNPGLMSMSNSGHNAIIETFMALHTNNCVHTSEKNFTGGIIKKALTLLKNRITVIFNDIMTLENNGQSDTTSIERITLAKQYSHLFTCASFVLYWHYNRYRDLTIDEKTIAAGLCYMLEDIDIPHHEKQDLDISVLCALDRKYHANQLFSFHETNLP